MRIDKAIWIGLAIVAGGSLIAQGSTESTKRPSLTSKIDWSTQTKLIVRKLNDPDPLVVIDFLKYLETHGFQREHFEQCRDYRWRTVEAILQSNSMDRERHYVINFLNRFSKERYEPNERQWLRRLTSMKYLVTA